ncbi:hypothetical protein SAMN05216602_4441 [Pseudomonas argentinensis]|uniref:Uncharacterized protein n=2 Tax=Phytopseudomonas argentinensis TaxID=289370 RepID=A0A1I3PTE1_9GAMM|nr:hypothetical protein SAMN05216602_4441 [Pseudomonas argentinensis]
MTTVAMLPRKLHRLTILGLVFFILGLIGVLYALYAIYSGPRPADPDLTRSLVIAAGMQLTGYVLLNRNRWKMMVGKSRK